MTQATATRVKVLANYDGGNGLTARQAIETANRKVITLVPNKSRTGDVTEGFDGRLVLTETWKKEKPVYPAHTGTFYAHGKPKTPMPTTIEYHDKDAKEKWVYDVPADARGQKDVILAVNHGFEDGKPIINLRTDGNRIVVEIDPKNISLIENFPAKDGWYLTDGKFGLTVGDKVDSSNPDARYLYRIGDEKAGLVARGYGDLLDSYRRYVVLNVEPSSRFGVLGLENVAQAAEAKPDVKALAAEVEKVLQKPAGQLTQDDWAKIRQLVEATKSQ